MKFLILSFALRIVSIVFLPFSVSLYTRFLSFHVPSISPFLSSEYRSEYTVPELTRRWNLLWMNEITS